MNSIADECPACKYRADHNDKAMYIATCKECVKRMLEACSAI